MALIISDETLRKADLTADRLLIDLACYLFERQRLSMGQARALTGLDVMQFQLELGKREIDQHYSEDDLADDLAGTDITL